MLNSMIQTENQIQYGSKLGEKTYSFVKHNQNKPTQWWSQESQDGKILFVVFYTQACRWSRCLGCNLPSQSSLKHVNYKSIIAQIEYLFTLPEIKNKGGSFRKLIISNNGSVLDQETFSSTALMYLLCKVNMAFNKLSVLSIETRPEFVDLAELEFLQRALNEGEIQTKLELAIGFEAFDEKIRNEKFRKGLSLEVFEDFIKKVATYPFQVKCYFMQKPIPGISDQEAVQDIWNGIDYLSKISHAYRVNINMHLNPTYVAYGTSLEKEFRSGNYSPPKLIDVARAALHAEGKNISIFIGLFDEGLAVKGGSFLRKGDERLVKQLEHFNKTQDYSILGEIVDSVRKKNKISK